MAAALAKRTRLLQGDPRACTSPSAAQLRYRLTVGLIQAERTETVLVGASRSTVCRVRDIRLLLADATNATKLWACYLSLIRTCVGFVYTAGPHYTCSLVLRKLAAHGLEWQPGGETGTSTHQIL